MSLLNYTTTVAAEKTLGEIQLILSKHGVKSIQMDFDNGEPVALSFLITTPFGERLFALPANIDGMFAALLKQSRNGDIPKRFATRGQASRTGWRTVKDWLEAQMAMIDAQMVTLDQVLLPYLVDDDTGQTIYARLLEQRLVLPSPRS